MVFANVNCFASNLEKFYKNLMNEKWIGICQFFFHKIQQINIIKSEISPTVELQLVELTLLTRISVWSKCLPYNLGASPVVFSILMQTSSPFFASSTCSWLRSILATVPSWIHCKCIQWCIYAYKWFKYST